MKIACYCQHVLGIGHFHRSLELCKALACDHETIMILGGPDVELPDTAVQFKQLPGLKMDTNFSTLLPCDPAANLEEIKTERQKTLLQFFKDVKPDIFLVELFPFGRKAFRFELDPILTGIGDGSLSPCLRLCSLRDILVEKSNRAKYETRVVSQLNTLFDGLLVHSDPDYIPLERTFSALDEIAVPLHYTGFVTPRQKGQAAPPRIRQELSLTESDKLIIASIGGGNVGEELLEATVLAAGLVSPHKNLHFHLFTGPYSSPGLGARLNNLATSQVTVHGFCDTFPEWLAAADLSISMAGYNTCMNLLETATPALLHPFAQNREQRMRIEAFSDCCGFSLLEEKDLLPERLMQLISQKLAQPRKQNQVDLDGAAKSRTLINTPHHWS